MVDLIDKIDDQDGNQSQECVALATGMKCHPHAKLPSFHGCVLHDWHAEILAIRAFNRFLVDECADLAAGTLGKGSKWLQWRRDAQQQQPFELQPNVSIHMYCSEAPCGDASMELTMAKQEDATPWESNDATEELLGRGHFSRLGRVRRKPSRPDAPPTFSKSCSDKLALKQCTGLLSALTAQLIRPEGVYIRTLTLPASEYVPAACERAFGKTGRMAPLVANVEVQDRWKASGFSFRPFLVDVTDREFEFSKRDLMAQDGEADEPVASNRSCLYTPRQNEVLINGVLEGRKLHDPKGASLASRRSMWASAREVARMVGSPAASSLLETCHYKGLKASEAAKDRERVKNDARGLALKGWVKNDGDDDWFLEAEPS